MKRKEFFAAMLAPIAAAVAGKEVIESDILRRLRVIRESGIVAYDRYYDTYSWIDHNGRWACSGEYMRSIQHQKEGWHEKG